MAYVAVAWLLRVVAGTHGALAVAADLAELAIPVAVVVLIARTARRLRSAAWWCLAAAATTWIGSSVAAAVIDSANDRFNYPSVADVGFLAVVPLLMAGTWKLSHGSAGLREQLRSLFDGLLVATSIVLVYSWFVLDDGTTRRLGDAGTAVSLAYVVGDILVVTTALSSREFDRPERLDLRLLAGAFVVFTVTDALFTAQVGNGTFGDNALPHLGWLTGFAMLAWFGYLGRPHGGILERRRVHNVPIYGALAAALTVTVVDLAVNGHVDRPYVWATVILATITGVRQFVSQTENDELHDQLEGQLVALSRSEARFRNVFEGIPDGIAVVERSATITWVNQSLARLLGRPTDDLVGLDARTLLESTDRTELVRAATEAGGDLHLAQASLRDASGNLIPVETTISNLTHDPAIRGFLVTVRDISDRVRRQNELSESKERFRRSFEAAPIGMAIISSDGRVVEANDAYARMLGRTVDEITDLPVQSLTHPDDVMATAELVHELVSGGGGVTRLEQRFVHADGHHVWGSLTVSLVPLPDGDHQLVNQVEDITDRRATLAQLAHNARHDTLTGLPNRAYFEEHLALSLERSSGSDRRLVVAFLDVDRFKVVNDNLGHRSGDELLRVVAERLRLASRPGDLVARFGGDEFTALFHDVPDEATAHLIATRLAEEVGRPIGLDGGETFVSLSVGLALSSTNMDAGAVDLLLRNADAAMYRAKEAGRDRIEVHHDSAERATANRHRLVNDLHRAVERGELVLHYQPMFNLHEKRIVSVECLLRWEHPEHGRLYPTRFIHLAEDTGLIVPIGAWTLETACRQLAAWNAERPPRTPNLRLSVNLSTRQLDADDLVEHTARTLAENNIDPRCLWFEITESTLMRDTTATIATMRRLRDLGVHLVIDDFGTGYSSLAYLRRIPVEALKIDRSFVAGLGRNDEDTTIVRAVVDLAHALGLGAVAEGVETEEQLALLEAIGCDVIQGYLLGMPTAPADLADPRALRSWPRLSEPAAPR